MNKMVRYFQRLIWDCDTYLTIKSFLERFWTLIARHGICYLLELHFFGCHFRSFWSSLCMSWCHRSHCLLPIVVILSLMKIYPLNEASDSEHLGQVQCKIIDVNTRIREGWWMIEYYHTKATYRVQLVVSSQSHTSRSQRVSHKKRGAADTEVAGTSKSQNPY